MRIPVPRAVVRIVAAPLVSLLARSWRLRVRHEERWHRLAADDRPFVFLLWHEALLPLLWRHRGQGIAIVVSRAREGRYLADYASALGYRTVSGSSSRGGVRALLGAMRALHARVPVAFTPDGPRGPRREVKPGVVRAAQRAGARILPLHAVARPHWRLRSWDRMAIPRPFARIEVGYGEPFEIPPGEEALARGVQQSAAALAALEAELLAG